VAPTCESRRSVFRRIAQKSHVEWPLYTSSPLYDRSSADGLERDCWAVSKEWFRHNQHKSVEQFVCLIPVAYFLFAAHDRFDTSTQYEMDTLFRVFVLKELHGWEHESALVEYLEQSPEICEKLGLEAVPDQSTLWRTWHQRFTADLQEAIETIGRTILLKAKDRGASVPREPERTLPSHDDEPEEPDFDDQEILSKAESMTEHVSRVVFQHSRWTVARAVKSMRTPTGAYRLILAFEIIWRPTRVRGVFSMSPTGTERRWATPTASRFEKCLSTRFE